MSQHHTGLPQMDGRIFLAYAGMETDLIFNKNVDLPGFASFPLLETEEGRELLESYMADLIAVARRAGIGVILESPTWVANRDRGAAIGYTADSLIERNIQAIELLVQVRQRHGDLPTIVSLNVGPRADAYAPTEQMSAEDAQAYHAEQISCVAGKGVDLVSGYTIAYPAEAIGIVRAAQQAKLPVVISFTVETDGNLPTGQLLKDAIETVDEATDGYASYFMINCAHPEHFDTVLSDAPWTQRLKGLIANASRCSHAELDEADVLDDGDPIELGQQIAAIQKRFPHITVVGGCCGTDLRHMESMATSISNG